jgi:serine/threonine protein kinase
LFTKLIHFDHRKGSHFRIKIYFHFKNRFSNGCQIISNDKLPNLKRINNSLLSTDKTLRPDCNEILERKSDWFLSPSNFPNEFLVKHFIQLSLKLKSLRKSFYYNFIESKFNDIFKKSFESGNAKYSKEFKELDLIAFGTYGIVCNAMDRKSYDLFAIKKIPFNKELKDSVMKEIQILQNLESDLVVRLKSVWIEDNYLKIDEYKTEENTNFVSSLEVFKPNKTLLLHIQMELCLMSLKELIKQLNEELDQKPNEVMTPLGYYISSELFKEILESVNYLHKQKVIHRDLKPNNILITNGMNGRFVKITDFGLATVHEFDEQSHTKYKGTIRYAAPEVMRTRNYDMKADIYSLSVILQDLFNIDINEYYMKHEFIFNILRFLFFSNHRPIGEGSKLENKYSKLFELTERMFSS